MFRSKRMQRHNLRDHFQSANVGVNGATPMWFPFVNASCGPSVHDMATRRFEQFLDCENIEERCLPHAGRHTRK